MNSTGIIFFFDEDQTYLEISKNLNKKGWITCNLSEVWLSTEVRHIYENIKSDDITHLIEEKSSFLQSVYSIKCSENLDTNRCIEYLRALKKWIRKNIHGPTIIFGYPDNVQIVLLAAFYEKNKLQYFTLARTGLDNWLFLYPSLFSHCIQIPEDSIGFERSASLTFRRSNWVKLSDRKNAYAKEVNHPLKSYYSSLVTSSEKLFPIGKSSILIGLSRDPGWTTQGFIKDYGGQLPFIEVIARLFPEKVLLIKEHPSQFLVKHDLERHRSKAFYDNLIRLQNVHFLPLDTDLNSIVPDVFMGVTVSGSLGWACLQRGVPVISFAPTWYSQTFGCIDLSNKDISPQKAQQMVEAASSNPANVIQSAKLLVAEIMRKGISGVDRTRFLQSPSGLELNAQVVARQIDEYFRQPQT